MALRYLRELRNNRGKNSADDPANLQCKICKDKTFTATATLMYHYRSHAGTRQEWQGGTIKHNQKYFQFGFD